MSTIMIMTFYCVSMDNIMIYFKCTNLDPQLDGATDGEQDYVIRSCHSEGQRQNSATYRKKTESGSGCMLMILFSGFWNLKVSELIKLYSCNMKSNLH